MARIRPYIQQVDTAASIPTRKASPDDLGGPGLMNLGQSIQHAGADVARAQAITHHEERLAQEKIEQQKRQASSIAVHRMISDEHLKSQQEELARQQRANPAYPDQHVNEAITFGKQQGEDVINRVIENPNSPILPEDYDRLRLGIAENANRVTAAASEFAAKINAAYQVGELNQTHENHRNIVQANPDLLADTIADTLGMMENVNTGGAVTKQKLTKGYVQDLWGAAADGRIDRVAQSHNVDAIDGLYRELTQQGETKDGKPIPNRWQQEMDHGAYAKALDRLNVLKQSELRQRDLLAEAAFKERRDERATGVANGFDPVAESAHIADPAKRELLIRDGEAAIRTGDAVNEINRNSFVQNMALLAKGDADLQTPGRFHVDAEVQNARQAAMSHKLQSIKNDLAGEALKNPVVAAAYQQMQSGKPEDVDGYARAMKAETERIAPWREVQLVPKSYEGQIQHVLGEIESGPRGADQALQILATERARWGAHWPTVLKQLTQDGILTPTQAVVARMGQDPSAIPDAKRLLVTAGLKPDQLNDLTPTGSRHAVQQALLKELAPVADALRGQVNGEKELVKYRDASETLALSYLMAGGGETSPEKAATRAAGVVIKNGFHWQGSYYVPKQYNPDAIQQAAAYEQQRVPVTTTDESLQSQIPYDPATFGTRPDGTPKGLGYFGVLKRPDGGISTELSMGFEIDGRQVEMPAINPLTTRKELDYLLSGGTGDAALEQSIEKKAYQFGLSRLQQGKSPFAQPGEQQLPPSATHVIPPQSSGLRSTDVTNAVIDSLKNKSRWVVNRAGDGLDLTWETGEQVLLQHSDGTVTPYSRTFKQLQEMGTPTKDWFGRNLIPEPPASGPEQAPPTKDWFGRDLTPKSPSSTEAPTRDFFGRPLKPQSAPSAPEPSKPSAPAPTKSSAPAPAPSKSQRASQSVAHTGDKLGKFVNADEEEAFMNWWSSNYKDEGWPRNPHKAPFDARQAYLDAREAD